jgi:hypothetical protein
MENDEKNDENKNDEKLRFDVFCHIYAGFSKYIEKLRHPLTPVQEKEKELVSLFTSGFQKIARRLTTQNIGEILNELCELRDDCHEKYEEMAKSYNLSLKPFRVMFDGVVIGDESSRRPCTKPFEYEGFLPYDECE